MFGRGTWAIVGLAQESLEDFKTSLEDRALMIAVSQMGASAITRQFNVESLGINPFSAPRLDEQHTINSDQQQELARFAASGEKERPQITLPAAILDSNGYGANEQQFQMNSTVPWYGLWVVSNQMKDVGDLASLKEQHSYEVLDRPYKFLPATDKKSVNQDTQGIKAIVRKQIPVLLDFNEGRIYIENSNKKMIHFIKELLKQLGIQIVPVAWTYNRPNWPSEILNKLYEGTYYLSDFQKRADEATRFKPNEIEKLEDRELESIVANYFSMTQLPNELWIGISSPAQIRLHQTSQSIVVKAPTSATMLLGVTKDANVVSGPITVQERITATSKKGGEFTFRKDILSVDVNDQINLTDVGAAMLRGFDIPAFRKDIQREIRKTREVPSIEQFWSSWLQEMSNAVRTMEASFRDILDLDGKEQGGILPMRLPVNEEELLELENA